MKASLREKYPFRLKESLTGIAIFHGSIVAQETTDTKKFKSAGNDNSERNNS
jgi:hypothetical protein